MGLEFGGGGEGGEQCGIEFLDLTGEAAEHRTQHGHDAGMRGVEAVLDALALIHQFAAQAALSLELFLRGTRRRPGTGFLRAPEVGDEGGVEPIGFVAAQGGLSVTLHGQRLKDADGVTGGVGVAGDREAVGAGGFQAEVQDTRISGPRQELGVAGRGVGHGEGAGLGQEQAGIELVFGDVDAQDGFGRTHRCFIDGLCLTAGHAAGRPSL